MIKAYAGAFFSIMVYAIENNVFRDAQKGNAGVHWLQLLFNRKK